MRQRYIVFHAGKAVGWVHATTAEEAIRKVCRITGNDARDCTAAKRPIVSARNPAQNCSGNRVFDPATRNKKGGVDLSASTPPREGGLWYETY